MLEGPSFSSSFTTPSPESRGTTVSATDSALAPLRQGFPLPDVPGRPEQGLSFTYDSLSKTLHTSQPWSLHLVNGLKLLYLPQIGKNVPLRNLGFILVMVTIMVCIVLFLTE